MTVDRNAEHIVGRLDRRKENGPRIYGGDTIGGGGIVGEVC